MNKVLKSFLFFATIKVNFLTGQAKGVAEDPKGL